MDEIEHFLINNRPRQCLHRVFPITEKGARQVYFYIKHIKEHIIIDICADCYRGIDYTLTQDQRMCFIAKKMGYQDYAPGTLGFLYDPR